MFDTLAIKESFDRAATDYDAHAELQREVRRQLISLAVQVWPRQARVLDAGCGTGAFFAETSNFDWRVIGLDVAPGMCKVARQHLVPVINSSVEAIPLGENIFDGVFSSLMLQWLDTPAYAFAEMARVLKPGCHAVISTFIDGTLDELKTAFAAIDDTPHVSEFLPTHEIIKQAKDAGFTLALARQVRIEETYPDTIALMRRLQNIGATNQRSHRRKGLMTSRQFTRLEQTYPHTKRGFPATWQTLYLVLQKL
jgi:malonyl-CoA O-methyltransferase